MPSRPLFLALLACALVAPAHLLASVDADDVFERVSHHMASSDGVPIHYASLGEGPVVLFVHGFPDFWYSWRHQMAGLSDQFRTVAMDTRGYNRSGQPEGVENYDMELLLSDIDAVIRDLGVVDVTLVGHDWGGAISWRYAMTRPELVNKLIICNLTHPNGYMKVRESGTEEQKAAMQYIAEFQKPDAASRFNPQMLAMISAGRVSEEERARYVHAFESSSVESMLNYYRAAWTLLSAGGEQELPDLTMPVLQFHGLKDTAVDKDGLSNTWDWIDADYTLVTIPEANHWVQRDAAELVTETMKAWLLARQ